MKEEDWREWSKERANGATKGTRKRNLPWPCPVFGVLSSLARTGGSRGSSADDEDNKAGRNTMKMEK